MALNAPTLKAQNGHGAQQYATEAITIANGVVTSTVYPSLQFNRHRFTYNNRTAQACTVQVQYSPNYYSLNDPITQNATTLNGAINAAVTTITVASTAGFPTTGTLRIDAEQVSYTGTTATTLTGCTRGANSTTAATHADKANVVLLTAVWVNLGAASASIAGGNTANDVLNDESEAIRFQVTSTATDTNTFDIFVESRTGGGS